ncbi:MAG: DUF4294 domain-containing protein [Bacteroidota bacterium]
MRRMLALYGCLLFAMAAYGQGTLKIDGKIYPYTLDDCGDTIILATFSDIPITSLKIFNSTEDRRRYDKYREYAVEVYPYAVKAINVFRQVEEASETMSKKETKKLIRQLKKDLKKEFTDPLKKLTRTQGTILMKMIEKELETPIFDLIKDLRGGLNASYWNLIGGLYGHRLKDGYEEGIDPILDGVLNDLNLTY